MRARWYRAPFRVSLRGVGPRCVGLARRISARCNTGSYVFSFFFICIFILFLYFSILFLENYWRVLTLTNENYRGEPHEIVIKCFENFVYPRFARRKKRQIPNGISKYLFINQFMNCFVTARGKSKIKTTGVSVK